MKKIRNKEELLEIYNEKIKDPNSDWYFFISLIPINTRITKSLSNLMGAIYRSCNKEYFIIRLSNECKKIFDLYSGKNYFEVSEYLRVGDDYVFFSDLSNRECGFYDTSERKHFLNSLDINNENNYACNLIIDWDIKNFFDFISDKQSEIKNFRDFLIDYDCDSLVDIILNKEPNVRLCSIRDCHDIRYIENHFLNTPMEKIIGCCA